MAPRNWGKVPRFVPRSTFGQCGFAQRRRSESNRRIEVLQTSALPLGYGAGGSKVAACFVFLNPSSTRLACGNEVVAFLVAVPRSLEHAF